MHVANLSLTDFRSYASAEVSLEPGVTAFVGPNGEGKTNLVEAIGYAATLGSHRTAADAPLVRAGADRAIVRVGVEQDGRRTLIELEINPGRANRARVNRGAVPRPREVLGLLGTVLFAPEDLALVKGDPGERRRFLDDLLVARRPILAAVRSDYDRVLKQRNALLKSAAATGARRAPQLSTLDVWDGHLARAGAELLAARVSLVEALRPHVDKAYEAIARGTGPARLTYRSSLGVDAPLSGSHDVLAAAIQAAIAARRKDELDRGVTLVGPHRDELDLSIGDLAARGYASHGESWSLALALRLGSYELLRGELASDPVLILDDVFAELDTDRRDRLAELAASADQVLVTAAVVADVPEALSGARFDVMDGLVTRVR
ncbi:MAG: DNA replication/repair protein RecF [Streptosporangiales bacterium]|nr:DNA replication/repair protein RecF [Streptosporangiales bacterium]MBO0891091.1 DNA replication/repair protein RecF [Acidothermales bacterium]